MILHHATDANSDALQHIAKSPMKSWLQRWVNRHRLDSVTNFLFAREYRKQRQLAVNELKQL